MLDVNPYPWPRQPLLGLFLALLGVAVAIVLAPFVVSALWAAILAFASWPLYARALRVFAGRAWPAALVMTLAMSTVLVLPTLWLLLVLRDDFRALADYLAAALADGRLHTPAFISTLPIVGADISAWLIA